VDKIKQILTAFSDAFENNKFLMAVREGLTALIPIIVLGSTVLLFKSFPVPAYQHLILSFCDGILLVIFNFIYDATINFLSIYMVIAICYKYALKNSGVMYDTILYPMIATACFVALSADQNTGITNSTFGSGQMFSAIITAVLVNKYMTIIRGINFKERRYLREVVDEALSVAVRTIVPAVIIISLFACTNFAIRNLFRVNSIQGLFEALAYNIFSKLGTGFLPLLIYIIMVQIMWFFGIQGNNVLDNYTSQLLVDGIHIFNKSFYEVFVIMGGSGSVLCLIIAILIFSKKQNLRSIAKLAVPACAFNISEIIILGLPLLFNPIFLIPFIIVPVVNGMIGYLAAFTGIVPIISTSVRWTTPVLISGYYATGSWKGSVLQLVCIGIGTLIYLPFVKMYEENIEKSFSPKVERLTLEFKRKEKYGEFTDFLLQNNEIGTTAKQLTYELRNAIDYHELYWVYHPQISSKGKCTGAEALLRWKHSIAGYIYPPLVIALAKEKDLLFDIERLMLDNVCKMIQELEIDFDDIEISINLTAESLVRENMEQMVAETVEFYKIKPEHLWFEITEQDALASSNLVIDKLIRLSEKGHKILIDDFGMGHTSLLYLQTYNFDSVKLDGCLTKSLLENNRNSNIISSIVYLSHTLHFNIIAEYVENYEQKEKLTELGCDGFQGFFFSKPLMAQDYIKFLKMSRGIS
jgi:lactose/cellobiose-specific phosphotransferase system IIC component